MDEVQKKILSRLQNLCARQECCTKDLLSKAQKALASREGYIAAPEAAQQIVASLVDDGYADDRRYSAAFAREKSSITGWGPVKIRMALAAKGISREIAEEALQEIDSERADAKLEKMLRSKWRSLCDDPQGRLKLIRFALGRGYGMDVIHKCIDKMKEEDLGDIDFEDDF